MEYLGREIEMVEEGTVSAKGFKIGSKTESKTGSKTGRLNILDMMYCTKDYEDAENVDEYLESSIIEVDAGEVSMKEDIRGTMQEQLQHLQEEAEFLLKRQQETSSLFGSFFDKLNSITDK